MYGRNKSSNVVNSQNSPPFTQEATFLEKCCIWRQLIEAESVGEVLNKLQMNLNMGPQSRPEGGVPLLIKPVTKRSLAISRLQNSNIPLSRNTDQYLKLILKASRD